VVAPFSLRDLRLLGRLGQDSVSLCPMEALTRPQSAVWTALISLLPLDEGASFTFVLDEQRRDGKQLQGFIQTRHAAARSSIYVRYLMPHPDADEDAQAVWNRLTSHLAAVAGERGIERVFACAADGSPEMTALLAAGFCAYTREHVFRRESGTYPQAPAQGGIRPEQSADMGEIAQLYRAVTPHLVQQAESPSEHTDVDWLCGPGDWNQGEGLVLQDRIGIAGYGHLTPGRSGHWLSILVHSRAYDRAAGLLDHCLAPLNYYPTHPVYCSVREYQGGIVAPLEERAFALHSVQCRMVRHTTVRVTEPARSLVPALEKRVEAPTTTVTPTRSS